MSGQEIFFGLPIDKKDSFQMLATGLRIFFIYNKLQSINYIDVNIKFNDLYI